MPSHRIIRLLALQLVERTEHRPACYRIFCNATIGGLLFFTSQISAQCPVNLGFEKGSFENWTCLAGVVDSSTLLKKIVPVNPLTNRHTIYKKGNTMKDPYGGFPVVCPNGSNYSIRLGNDSAGSQVDGVSYLVTVPADKDVYSIIYNYAVVLQNPNHKINEQPRFTAKVFDVASNQYLDCSSFDFAASSSLPGFKLSAKVKNASIYYKPWSPITIKLVGYAGKTVKIEFVVNDCTLGAHFGYAYLDINEDCSTPISGNVVCAGAPSTTLVAPFGFREYHWYNEDFSQELGASNTLDLAPVPAAGKMFAVEVLPYPGSGCVDTLYAAIRDSPTPFLLKLADTTGACSPAIVDLTAATLHAGSTPGINFSYFIDSTLTEYLEGPDTVDSSGRYFIKAYNADGCLTIHPIQVVMDTVPNLRLNELPGLYYPNTADITDPSLIGSSTTNLTFSYWSDAAATQPLANPKAINIAGVYYIKANSRFGCTATQPITVVMQIPPPPNGFSPNGDGVNDFWLIPALSVYPQCTVDVYSRSGRLVFHSNGYNKPWDGNLNGMPLPVATYYYVIKASDKLLPLSGSITLIR